jgi:hypothetical protein
MYVDVKTNNGKVRQMKKGSKLGEKKINKYSNLVDEFSDTFVESYDELRGYFERWWNITFNWFRVLDKKNDEPLLTLLLKAELERFLKTWFIKSVEITDWVSPMVLVKKKFRKLRVCMDYRKLNACTQNDHLPLPFVYTIVGGGR